MKTTQVRLDTDTAKQLRAIAAQFGFFTERGLGAGEIGNTAAMLEAIAQGRLQIVNVARNVANAETIAAAPQQDAQ